MAGVGTGGPTLLVWRVECKDGSMNMIPGGSTQGNTSLPHHIHPQPPYYVALTR